MRSFWFCGRRLIIFIFGMFLFSTLDAFFEELSSARQYQGLTAESVSFNKDATLLAVSGHSNILSDETNLAVYQFDKTSTPTLIRKYSTNFSDATVDVFSVAWQNTRNILAVAVSGSIVHFIKIYEWDGSQLITKSTTDCPENTRLAWNPAGTLLAATSGSDVFIYRWNGSILTLSTKYSFGDGGVEFLSWSQDGNFLAGAGSVGSDGLLVIFQWDNDKSILTRRASVNCGTRLHSVDWGPSSNRLAVGGVPQLINIYSWDKVNFILSQEYTQRFENNSGNEVNSVAWDGYEGYLSVTGYDVDAIADLVVYKWDPTVSNSLNRVDGVFLGGNTGTSLSWSPDSLYLAVVSNAGTGQIKIFKTQAAYDQGKTINPLTIGQVVRDVHLMADFVVDKLIVIAGTNVEINGNGNTLTFQPETQFVVEPQADVTLDNINLSGLTKDTLDLKYRQPQRQGLVVKDILSDDSDETREIVNNVDVATMIIGDNVNFDLLDDCVLQSGLIQFRQEQRQKSISDTPSLRITGVDGNKSFILDPSDAFLNVLRQKQKQKQPTRPGLLSENDTYMFDLTGGTLELQNVVLQGTTNIRQGKQRQGFPFSEKDLYLFDLTDGTLELQNAGLQGMTNIRQRQRAINIDFGEFGIIALNGNAEVDTGDSFRQRQRQRQKDIKVESENLKITPNVQERPECGLDMIVTGEGNKISMLDDNTLYVGQVVFADTGINSLEIRSELTSAIVNPTDDPNRVIPQIGFGTNFMNLTSLDGTAKLIFSDPRIRVDNEYNGFLVGQNSTLVGNGVEIYGDPIRYQYDPLTESAPLRLAVKNLTASAEIDNVPLFPVLPLLSFSQEQNLLTDKNNLEKSDKEDSEKSITRQIGLSVIHYYKETIDLGQAQGNVVLDQTIANNFSVHPTAQLNLTLKDGSVLVLKDEAVILKPEDKGNSKTVADVITIVGKNNIIYVPNIFTITGDLIFEAGAELKIISLDPNATIFWGNFVEGTCVFHNPITLEEGSKLSFRGPGTVVFGDLDIKLNGSGSDSLTSRPLLTFENSIKVRAYSTLYVYGIGDIRNENAYLDLTNSAPRTTDAGVIQIGRSVGDNINFINNGVIHLRGIQKLLQDGRLAGPNSYNGTLSFIAGESQLIMMPGSILDVDEYGILAINIQSYNDVSTINAGIFKGIFLSPKGQLSIKPNGKIIFAENKDAFNPVDKKLMTWQADGTVTFDGTDALGRTGIIKFISPNSTFDFDGQMLFNNGNFSANNLSAQELVRRLVNRGSVLTTAAQVLDSNNIDWVRLKNGKKIQMQAGDTILGENSDGSVRGKNSAGRNIIFTLTGIRQVN